MLWSLCRWGAGPVSLWAEGSGHHPLLHLHCHHPARGGAGVRPGRERHSLSCVLKIPQIPRGAAVKGSSGGGLGAEVVMSEPSSLEAAQDEEEELMVSHVFLLFVSPSAPSQKINRRLHLSKVKHSKFNESGQLVAFHLTSVIWCSYVVVTVRHRAGWHLGFQGELWVLEHKIPQAAESPASFWAKTGTLQSVHFSAVVDLSSPCRRAVLGDPSHVLYKAVKYLWSWAPEILPGSIISILCSRT